jgi:hypothetical protein
MLGWSNDNGKNGVGWIVLLMLVLTVLFILGFFLFV